MAGGPAFGPVCAAVIWVATCACGGGASAQRAVATEAAYGPGMGLGGSFGDEETARGAIPADLRELDSRGLDTELAQATTPGREPTEDRSEPILIYTATLYMGVYQVEQSQQQVIAIASELGGFLFSQDDTTVVIRIPAERFDEAIGRLADLGDVLHRNIQVQDVSEEFHDLNIRLETMHAMRGRLEELLARTTTVAEALQIERELQRLTLEIETIEGRLRFLRDRVAFSTITVTFQSNVPGVQSQAPVRLPFPWIAELGLNNLLSLW